MKVKYPHYTSGYDHFTPEPGKLDKMSCRACGAEMAVERNVTGPTGWAEAMAKKGHAHDSFACPNYDQDWHEQLIKLLEYQKTIPAKALRDLIEPEIRHIRNNHDLEYPYEEGW